jgi:hypothetical protein
MEAAYPAFCSWRNEITRRPEACSFRVRSVIGDAGKPEDRVDAVQLQRLDDELEAIGGFLRLRGGRGGGGRRRIR